MTRAIHILCTLAALAGAARASTRRIAVVVGANQGAPGEPALQYAGADADKLAAVLVERCDVGLIARSCDAW